MEVKEKVVFITHPYYGVNNPNNNLRIYKKSNNSDKWHYTQCKNKDDYRKKITEYICGKKGFFDYSRNEEKANVSMIEYFLGSKKSESIMKSNKMKREEMAILKDGSFLKDEQIENMQKNWSKYLEESNVQLAVLSMYQDYVDENINIKDLQKEVSTKLLPRLFKYCGYKNPEKNLEWIVSLHSDRENNYHFHIAWIEKEKCYKLKNNKLDYRRKLHLTDKENNFMKRQVSLAIERNKLYKPVMIKINKDLDELKSYFNPKDHNFTLKNINNLELEEDIVKLGELLSEIRSTNKKYIKYNSLPNNKTGKLIKKLTNKIKKKLFDEKIELNLSRDNINESIEELNKIFTDIDKRNGISDVGFQSAFDNKLIKDKLEKEDNYILNSIVNHALYSYDKKNMKKNDKIKLEDLICEQSIIIYKSNYKNIKNEKIRLKILKNYFIKGKYENYDKLSNSLRRLSRDSDAAANKFYEMLSDNSYDKNL